MKYIFGLLIALIILRALEEVYLNEKIIPWWSRKLPYRRKDYLLTIAERNFYEVLKRIADENNSLLFAKVRLEDLLWIPKGTENRWGFRNRIKSRHIDFVICDTQNIRPLLAIELDDSSHERQDRIERDQNIDHILHDAGLPILHVKVQQIYDKKFLLNQIQNKINTELYK